MAVQEGALYRAVVEGYASDGSGVARVEGLAVFVRGAVRGETVDLRIEHIGHSAAWGHIEGLAVPSPARREPDCPYYGRCGGCQFRHMSYEEELEAKRLRVEDALARLGGIHLPVEVIHGARNTQRYRNKVQFPIAPGAIGYFQGRTHRVVDIDDCLLQPEVDTVCRAAVKGWMDRFQIPAYRERTGEGLLRHLYLRTNQAGQALCCLVANGGTLPHGEKLVAALRGAAPGLAGVVLNVNMKKTNVILGREFHTLWGQNWLEEELCGHTFRLSVPSFFQINRAQTEVLYRRALDFAGLTGEETVVDLYCGIGTISLTLADHARRVIGVEVVPQAVADARANAARNGLANKTRFECGDASALAARLEGEGIRPDVVVVDPPRKGLAGPGGAGDSGLHGAGAHRLRLLRPGHPGPGRGPVPSPGLCPPPDGGGGPLPPHRPCGDGPPAGSGRRGLSGRTAGEKWEHPQGACALRTHIMSSSSWASRARSISDRV